MSIKLFSFSNFQFWEHIYVNIQFLSIFWFYLSIFLLFGLDVCFFPFVSYFDLLILLFDIICFDVEVVVLILMIWLISLLGFQLFSKFYFRDKFYFLFDCVHTWCFAFSLLVCWQHAGILMWVFNLLPILSQLMVMLWYILSLLVELWIETSTCFLQCVLEQ
jgi:hypothetical protein